MKKTMKKTMTNAEQHMRIIENQRKNYEQTKEKPMRTTEKPMRNQRRNNEKQWKTKDNFASILSYFLEGTFGPCFFSSFPSSMGKEIRDNFERKRKRVLRRLGD